MTVQRIGVLAASGGVGASTLALGLAGQAAAAGLRTACVDGQWFSGGIDVIAGIEEQPGLRWPDLRRMQSPVDGRELLAELPSAAGVAIVSTRRSPSLPVTVDAVMSVLDSLAQAVDICVVDLPRWGLPMAADLTDVVDDLLLVQTESAIGLAGTAAVYPLLEECPGRPWLVHRGGTTEVARMVAELTGVPLLRVVPDDRAVPRALTDGAWPGSASGPFSHACREILTELRLQVVRS